MTDSQRAALLLYLVHLQLEADRRFEEALQSAIRDFRLEFARCSGIDPDGTRWIGYQLPADFKEEIERFEQARRAGQTRSGASPAPKGPDRSESTVEALKARRFRSWIERTALRESLQPVPAPAPPQPPAGSPMPPETA